MPRLPAVPRTFTESSHPYREVPPGRYLCVLTDFPDEPKLSKAGNLNYRLQFEIVRGEEIGMHVTYFIQSDVSGLPSLKWTGEGRWRALLKSFCLDSTQAATIDTPELLYRPCIGTVNHNNGFTNLDLEKCSDEEQEYCLEYVNRKWPLKE